MNGPETATDAWRPGWAIIVASAAGFFAVTLTFYGLKAATADGPWPFGRVLGPPLAVEGMVSLFGLLWFLAKRSMAGFVVGLLALLPITMLVVPLILS